jgi:hypothetical protein
MGKRFSWKKWNGISGSAAGFFRGNHKAAAAFYFLDYQLRDSLPPVDYPSRIIRAG